MLTQIKLYLLFAWYQLAIALGFQSIDRDRLKRAYRHHHQIATFFGCDSERTRSLEVIRSAAGRVRLRTLQEFLLLRRLLTAANIRHEIYTLLIQLGDLSPMDLMLRIGLRQQRQQFDRYLAGHIDQPIAV